jgi:hypothetical protein
MKRVSVATYDTSKTENFAGKRVGDQMEDKKDKKKDVETIIRGIQQAFRNSKEVGQEIGLRREEYPSSAGPGWTKLFDNFTIKIVGNTLFVTYCTQLTVDQFHEMNLVKEVEAYADEAVKYLKSEYKDVTGHALKLTDMKEDPVIKTEHISYQRMTLYGTKKFKIGSIETLKDEDDNVLKKYRNTFKDYLKSMKLTPKDDKD